MISEKDLYKYLYNKKVCPLKKMPIYLIKSMS